MDTHVKVVAVLNIVAGACGLLLGLFTLLFFGGIAAMAGASGEPMAPGILGAIGSVIAFIAFICSIPTIVIGIGLWRFRPWARVAGIVISVLHLFWMIPFSTIVGIYGLIVLFNKQTEGLFVPETVGVGR